jgi:hypothetical protein
LVEPSPCPDCGQPILWLTTATGARMPVDADPDPHRGNVVLIGHTAGVLGHGKARAARAAGLELRTHHKLKCPRVDRWADRRRTQ